MDAQELQDEGYGSAAKQDGRDIVQAAVDLQRQGRHLVRLHIRILEQAGVELADKVPDDPRGEQLLDLPVEGELEQRVPAQIEDQLVEEDVLPDVRQPAGAPVHQVVVGHAGNQRGGGQPHVLAAPLDVIEAVLGWEFDGFYLKLKIKNFDGDENAI